MAGTITLDDVVAARGRMRPHLHMYEKGHEAAREGTLREGYLAASPLRRYAALDAVVGHGIRVWVKHENHLPTNAFKVRNALSALTNLDAGARRRGVVAASRGNHGMGLAYAGAELKIPVTICVPMGNNPEKNEAIRGFGAALVEEGRDYDESVTVAMRIVADRGAHLVHSTNDRDVIAGAGTLTLEMLEENPSLGAIVFAIGGGSQAVGGLTVVKALRPAVEVFGVQSQGASAIHDSWHAGVAIAKTEARTFADGLATRGVYEMTFAALREGLAGFVAVSEEQLMEACRALLRTTHNLVEGAGAAGLAGLLAIATSGRLDGCEVGIVLSGSNVDLATLRTIVNGSK